MRFILSFVFLLALSSTTSAQTDSAKIFKAFEDYKTAILNDKGEEAVAMVDKNTLNYYSMVLELAKKADSVELSTLPILDKFMVLTVKHRTPKEDILRYDGKALLVYAIKSGMVGKSSVVNNSLGKIDVKGDSAYAQLVVSSRPTPLHFMFHKESGNWKVDLTSIFPASAEAFKKIVGQSGKTDAEFFIELLTNLTGKEPGPGIWHPLQ